VGGAYAGGIALGRYSKAFEAFSDDIDMFYVVNCRRFLTRTAVEALELMYEIETAAQMKHTAIVNNTNLLYETTAEILEESTGFAREISEKSGLPIAYTCVPLGLSADVPNPFPVEIYVKKVWEN
ncbi:MAG: cobalamin biosynthesis protein CobQ, partial [Oscillospiraceae bacterium]|nr:cobalamin biosynthesis protein CobQ [Oscillospiraceae bacterium]